MNEQGLLVSSLMRYLLENPDAKDSVEGIATYWLPNARSLAHGPHIQAILTQLLTAGWITEIELPGTPKLYGLNRQRVEEITQAIQRKR
jgi:hypothetical protein